MLASHAPDVMVRADSCPDAVFPLVGTVVHHGGTGTLLAACAHLKPMVIVPFFLDQPLHAARMQTLIGAPTIPALEYSRDAAVQALRQAGLQRDSTIAQLRALMAECRDGAEQSAHEILAALSTDALQLRKQPCEGQ
jgi:UDP:flavonoid glycosyltransferase YjiC (YdhE family)